ncbi:MAG: ferredoxin--NADP reductase [Gammaproteobacteria bacterium]|nr:ferredoxin--NADP reductase [Gammaproteobacteria bacterium]
MAKWIKAKVIENIQWHSRLFSLRIEADLPPFMAGQFTKLALEINGARLARAYSFVNSPNQSIHEFYYVSVDDGGLSPQLAKLTVGDSVLVSEQASGFFTLDDIPAGKELWLLSTGTAIGPYLSILATAGLVERFEYIVLVHCVRHLEDLSYRSEIADLVEQYRGRLVYLPIVTRQVQPEMLSERVPSLIENGLLAAKAKVDLDPDTSQVMICGNPEMVRATTEMLLSLGFSKNLRRAPGNITVENYW